MRCRFHVAEVLKHLQLKEEVIVGLHCDDFLEFLLIVDGSNLLHEILQELEDFLRCA